MNTPNEGSRREESDQARPDVVRAEAIIPVPGVMITQHLWISWFKIVKRSVREASIAREECKSAHAAGEYYGRQMDREFEASLVAVSAAGDCLDALYGSLAVPATVRTAVSDRLASSKKAPSRHAHIREALRSSFSTAEKDAEWKKEFTWLYGLRNFAAHAKDEAKTPVPHPLGYMASPEQVNYSLESADRALRLVTDVFLFCSQHPRAGSSDSVHWATQLGQVVKSVYSDLPE